SPGASAGSTATGSAIAKEPGTLPPFQLPSGLSSRGSPLRGEEHLRQYLDVQASLFRRRAALLASGPTQVKVVELECEVLAIELGDPDVVRRSVPLAAPVDGRVLLQPGGGEGQRPDGLGEEERDGLAVLVRVQELDPGAVPAGPAGQADC